MSAIGSTLTGDSEPVSPWVCPPHCAGVPWLPPLLPTQQPQVPFKMQVSPCPLPPPRSSVHLTQLLQAKVLRDQPPSLPPPTSAATLQPFPPSNTHVPALHFWSSSLESSPQHLYGISIFVSFPSCQRPSSYPRIATHLHPLHVPPPTPIFLLSPSLSSTDVSSSGRSIVFLCALY